MLVQALKSYADTYLQDVLAEPAFEEKPVRCVIAIDEDGTFAGVRQRTRQVQRGKRMVEEPLPLRVFKSPDKRASGTYPILACDGVQYLLGPSVGAWTSRSEVEKHRRQHAAFVKLVRKAAQETQDPALLACARFYARPEQVEKARHAVEALKLKPRERTVTFMLVSGDPASQAVPRPIVERPTVEDYWRRYYESRTAQGLKDAARGTCLVCGRDGPIAATHDKIKGLANVGGQPSGVSLMSFDKFAFRSYGWKQNANSPVDPRCAAAYVQALNDLLRHGLHRRGRSPDRLVPTRFDAGGVAFIFWTREPSDDDFTALFENPKPEDVQRLFEAPFKGVAGADVEANEFYLAAVSGNGGRLLVRCWFREALANVRENVRRWFRDQRVADVFRGGEPSEAPPLWQLLASISASGKADDVPAERAVQLVRRALLGVPLGRTILAAALARLRVAQGNDRLSPQRMGLVRMAVNDIARAEGGGPMMCEKLDPELEHPAYICGRLLAVYERLQYAAQGELNVSVGDRYYAMASTYPELAFPKLETLSKTHLKKLRRDNPGAMVNIERQINDLMLKLSGRFPKQLNIEEQGRFAIGYHHQKAEDARSAAEHRAQRQGAIATD